MGPTTVAGLLLALALPRQTGAQVVQRGAPPHAQVIAAAGDVIRMARYSTLVTIGQDGQPQARIVDPFVPDSDFTIWIATNPLTRKVTEIQHDPRVTLLYFNAAAGEYVTVLGTARQDLTSRAARHALTWRTDATRGD